MTFLNKRTRWVNKKKRISYKVKQKANFPRVIVFKSNKNIYVQLLDMDSSKTICSSSSIDNDLSKNIEKKKNKIDMSKIVAENLYEKMKKNNIKQVVFDRNGYRYHGRVKMVADTLREKGISL